MALPPQQEPRVGRGVAREEQAHGRLERGHRVQPQGPERIHRQPDAPLHDTQNSAHAPPPARGPATMIASSTSSDSGRPAAISRSGPKPLRSSQGLTMPQVQNAQSMHRLIQNSPVADSSGV